VSRALLNILMKISNLDTSKKYGILLSGGLDSAVLLYLLIKECPDIHLQPFTIPKYDGSALYAVPLVDHFNNKFGLTIPSPIFVGDPEAHHTQQSTTAIIEIFKEHPVDFLYMGVNTNPTELNNLQGAPKRKLESPNPRLLYPFAYLTKDKILEIMFNEGQEDLANITHSCTEQQVGRCNKCWQCTERAWAFKQIDKKDTGTL
jgi:hypothetical protein